MSIATNVVSSNPVQGDWSVLDIYHYVIIEFVSDLRQVGGFLRVLRFLPPLSNKIDRHDIIEIMLKVALNTINQPNLYMGSDLFL